MSIPLLYILLKSVQSGASYASRSAMGGLGQGPGAGLVSSAPLNHWHITLCVAGAANDSGATLGSFGRAVVRPTWADAIESEFAWVCTHEKTDIPLQYGCRYRYMYYLGRVML